MTAPLDHDKFKPPVEKTHLHRSPDVVSRDNEIGITFMFNLNLLANGIALRQRRKRGAMAIANPRQYPFIANTADDRTALRFALGVGDGKGFDCGLDVFTEQFRWCFVVDRFLN
ncbi:MAG TPA: hypothetical protein VL026_03230, partial [Rhizomicrobium sp.]|nr:hypothetical protein [Rhizomicrobium sp.]